MIYSDESAKSQLLPEKLVHLKFFYYGIFVSVVKMDEEKKSSCEDNVIIYQNILNFDERNILTA